LPVPSPGLEPAWLPGDVEVQVSGETFHADAIREAGRRGRPGVPDVAVLIPEPDNPHDHNAVAVCVNGFLVGHLSREIAGTVQRSLIDFTAANSGRTVACPARILWHEIDSQPAAQVVLLLDPAPLGLEREVFDQVPEIDRVIQQQLCRLNTPAPAMTGYDPRARSLLATAEELRCQADAEYGHGAVRWPEVEHAFRRAIAQLEHACDPQLADAWAGLACSVRYQKGRRDDWINAAVTSLYWDRSNKTAWAELVDLASAAPHVPTLLDLFLHVPTAGRPPVLTKLIRLSRGQDRLGNMRPDNGERLRAGLAAIGETEGDTPTIKKLYADARKHQGTGR
jgi:HIRAN domain